jgi:hypothetical protein
MAETRSYTVEIKDIENGQTVMLMAADWDDNDKRIAVAQLMRLAGVPNNNCFLDEVAPKPEPYET